MVRTARSMRTVRTVRKGAGFFLASCLLVASLGADEVAGTVADLGGEEVVLVLSNGDTLSGMLVSQSEERVVIQHPTLGEINVPTASIAEPLVTRKEFEASLAAVEESEKEEEIKEGLFGSSFLRGWDRNFSFGLSGSQGNATTLDVNSQLLLSYKTENYRLKSDTQYFVSTVGDDFTTTKNQAYSAFDADWLFPTSKWFAFSVTRWDYDEFRGTFDHRIAVSAGPGYQFLDSDRFQLSAKVGPGFNRTFGGSDPGWTFELFAGFDFTWVINEYMTFTTANTIFPNLSNPGEFRTVSNADLKTDIADTGFNFSIGIVNEYNTEVRPKRNDLNYYANVGYDF